MKLFKYSAIVNKNCHWFIKLCYYLGIVKIKELNNAYAINIRFYNPITLIFAFLFYIYQICSGIFYVFKDNAKNIVNDIKCGNDRDIIIRYKDGKTEH